MATNNSQSQLDTVLAKSAIVFTDSAATKVSELILDEGNMALKLRVFIQGGGCSGFQYGFTFDDKIQEGDTIIDKQVSINTDNTADTDDDGRSGAGTMTVQLLVDPMSFQYLVGAEIDYKKDVSGEQFVIRNPNAKTTCGCGSSFSA